MWLFFVLRAFIPLVTLNWLCDNVPELTNSCLRLLLTCRMLLTYFLFLSECCFFCSHNWRDVTICNMCYKLISVCFDHGMSCASSQMFSHWHLTKYLFELFPHQLHFLVFWFHRTFNKNYISICLPIVLVQDKFFIEADPWLRLGVCMLKQW